MKGYRAFSCTIIISIFIFTITIIYHFPTQTVAKKIQEYSTKEFSNYKNAILGISMQYPSYWIINESKSQVTFWPRSENNTDSSITIQSIPTLGATLEEKISESINSDKQNLASFHLIGSNASTLAGNQSYNLLYSYTNRQSGIYYKGMNIYTINRGKEYSISYIEKADRYSSYLPIVQRMVDSLRIQGSDNNIDQLGKSIIRSGNRPTGISVNPKTDMIYVANFGSNSVSVIDDKTGKTVTNITVGSGPESVAVIPNANAVYVANFGSNSVSVIDSLTNTVVGNIKVGEDLVSLAVDPDQTDFWVFAANRSPGTVSVIGVDALKVVYDIPVGRRPSGLAVNPITNVLYVANQGSNTVSVINYFTANSSFSKLPSTINFTAGSLPVLGGITFNPNTNMIYIANIDSNTISVINGSTGRTVTNVPVGNSPFHLAVNPNTNKIYVANKDSDSISVIDGYKNREVANIILGSSPTDLTINLVTNTIYVTSYQIDGIYVVNGITNKLTSRIVFKINTSGSGHINCNGKNFSDNDYVRYDLNTAVKCTAQPNSGFAFGSWYGDIAYNKNNDSVTTFKVSRDGTLAANFNKLPPPPVTVLLPKEYYDTLYSVLTGIILAPLAGWLIPFIAERNEKKRQLRYLRTYIPLIEDIYEKHREDKEKCLQLLDQERIDITALLKDGLINDSSYDILTSRISEYVDKLMGM